MTELTGPKALLLRVGSDRGTGGALGPIFSDGTFEYIPIPEAVPTRSAVTYATLPGRHVASLGAVLPPRLGMRHPHLDPDFATATYGDAALNKRRQLLRLTPGDLMVFYSGLAPLPAEDRPRLFAIGRLRVKEVHHLRSSDLDRGELKARFGASAHFLRRVRAPELALVVGEPAEAALFERAIPLGDGRNCLLRDLVPMGYEGSLLRAVGHWIKTPDGFRFLENWLREGAESLVSGTARLVVVASAPRVTGDGDLVFEDRRLREGDWALSVGGGTSGRAFACGRINRTEAENGRALSSLYWLFSAQSPDTSAVMPPSASRSGIVTDGAAIRRLVAWFGTRYRIGRHGSDGSGAVPQAPSPAGAPTAR